MILGVEATHIISLFNIIATDLKYHDFHLLVKLVFFFTSTFTGSPFSSGIQVAHEYSSSLFIFKKHFCEEY